MKTFKLSWVLVFAVLLCAGPALIAQQNTAETSKKKVVIITKTIDENGKEVTKKIVKEGAEADEMIVDLDVEHIDGITIDKDIDVISMGEDHEMQFFSIDDLEELPAEARDRIKNLNIDVDHDGTENHIRIQVKGADGNPEVIEWKGAGEAPADLREKLKAHGVHFNQSQSDGEHRILIDQSPNGPCLGVMIGKTVENENGEETIEGESEDGVKILSVIEGSAAEAAGLLEDDLIASINGTAVQTIQEVIDNIQAYSAGTNVDITYLRDGQVGVVTAQLQSCGNTAPHIEISEEIEIDVDNDGSGSQRIIIIKRKQEGEAVEEKEIIEEVISPEEIPAIPDSQQTLDLENIDLFPNPSDGRLTVQFEAEALPTIVRVVDLNGKEVFRDELNSFDGNYQRTLDLSEEAKGAYFLSISQKDKVFTETLILQ